MQILAHRGLWQNASEKNTRRALNGAFNMGFGAETDVRDFDGELVISHDMPRKGALRLVQVLDDYACAGQPGVLAINIKADGLTESLMQLLAYYGISQYFCFDMSVPDTLPYAAANMKWAARLSEYEAEGAISAMAPGLWIDSFHPHSFLPMAERFDGWLNLGKQLCLVSPELHGHSASAFMEQLSLLPEHLRLHPNLMICTDNPLAAREILS